MYLEKIVSLFGNWELKITSGQLGVMFFMENEKRKKKSLAIAWVCKTQENQCNLLQVLKIRCYIVGLSSAQYQKIL